MKFIKKNVETQKVAFIKHIGNVKEMSIIISKLMEWIYKNNIKVIGYPFIIYITDPNIVNPDKMVYDIAIPVSGDVEGNTKIKIKILPESTVISTIHKGEYTNIGEAYQGLWDYIVENKYEVIGFPKEIYFNNPQEVSSEQLLTEIQFRINE